MVVLTVVLIVAEVLLITAVVPVQFTVLRRIIPSHVCVYRYRPANKKLLQYGIWSEPQITINICCSRPGDFLYHVYHPPKVLNRLSHVDCSYSCRIFGKGDPCLEFSMAVSAGSGTRRPQPADTSNTATNDQVSRTWKRNTMYVANLDTCTYFIHAGHQSDPHRPVYLGVATEFK